ncbi:MAG: type II toxin-antitoxin system death-on-curing family toxin [Chloroherpetonaceae bacterium]|nr:type II toxin-antitoxin system death-on-curing family toxin [Chloroherpetonaceae bacterium]
MEYLIKNDIIAINQLMIEKFGGNYVPPENLLKPAALDYLIEIVNAEVFGTRLYPEIHHIAGVYFFNIIDGHIFQDGNKRTGLEASLLFLKLNDYELHASNQELIDFATDVGSGKETLETVQAWIKSRLVKSSN